MRYPQTSYVICLVCPVHVRSTERKLTFMMGGGKSREDRKTEKQIFVENREILQLTARIDICYNNKVVYD